MRKQSIYKDFINRKFLAVEVGYYDNRTNYDGATFGHTNIRIGPRKFCVTYHASFDSFPFFYFPERENKLQISMILPVLGDLTFEVRRGWVAKAKRPKIGGRYYDPIEKKSKVVDEAYLNRDWDFIRTEDGEFRKSKKR